MNDFKMTDILKGFDKAATPDKDKPLTEVTPTKNKITDNAAMKNILEGLDSAQKSVNQMPAQHKMAKNTATKHPASKFLVGGEYDDEPNADELDHRWDQENMTGVVTAKIKDVMQDKRDKRRQQAMGHQSMGSIDLDDQNKDLKEEPDSLVVPFDADARTNKLKRDKAKFEPATTTCPDCNGDGTAYGDTCPTCKGHGEIHEDTVAPKKQSLADIFRSMDEAEADKTSRLEKEFYSKLKEKGSLNKGENGKFDLAEEPVKEGGTDTTANFDGMVSDMKRLMAQGNTIHVTAKESHVSDRYKGEIVSYSIEIESNDIGFGVTNDMIDAAGLPGDELSDDAFQEDGSNTISSGQDAKIDQLVSALAEELFQEGVRLAKEVWEDEGPGRTNAQNEKEYVEQATKKFLDPSYQREIMANVREEYKELHQDSFPRTGRK